MDIEQNDCDKNKIWDIFRNGNVYVITFLQNV